MAGRCFVARVENTRYRLEANAIGQCAHVVAAIEILQVERIGGSRRPQSQRVDVRSSPSGDGSIEGDGGHRLCRPPHVTRHLIRCLDFIDRAAESDRVRDFRALELPWIAEGEPVLG